MTNTQNSRSGISLPSSNEKTLFPLGTSNVFNAWEGTNREQQNETLPLTYKALRTMLHVSGAQMLATPVWIRYSAHRMKH